MNNWLKSVIAGLAMAALVFLFYQKIIPQKNMRLFNVHYIAEVNRKNGKEIINAIPVIIRRRAEAAGYIAIMKIIDDKTLDITIQHVDNLPLIRKIITKNNQLEFREMYSLNEISLIQTMGDEVAKKYLPPPAVKKTNSRKADDSSIAPEVRKLMVAMEKTEEDAVRTVSGLGSLILFNSEAANDLSSYHIGSVSEKDTAIVNKILADGELLQSLPHGIKFYYGPAAYLTKKEAFTMLSLYAIRTRGQESALLQNRDIENAKAGVDINGLPEVILRFNSNGARKWEQMTRDNTGRGIAIIIDHFVISAPRVLEAISGGQSRINGGFSLEEVQVLASQLNGGTIPADLTIIKEEISSESSWNTFQKLLLTLLSFVIATGLAFFIFNAVKSK